MPAPVTTWTYDALGNPLTETDVAGNTVYYEYDASGLLLYESVPVPSGTTWTDTTPGTQYEYDAAGLVRTVTDPIGRRTEYVYDSNGRVKSTTDAEGNSTAYHYDAIGRLLMETGADPDGDDGPLSSLSVNYEYWDTLADLNGPESLPGGLFAAWNFDQTPDITFVPDWSGNGADLTAANVQLDDFVESATYSDQDRHALEFNTPYGTTLETDFAAAREVNTIATWVRSENPIVAAPVGIGDVLMEFNDASGNGVATWLTIGPFIGTGINNETISLVQYLGGTNFRITAVTDAGELEVDEWAHVAFVWNETAGRYDAFINGQQAPVSTTGSGHVDRIEAHHVGFGRRQLYGSPAYLNGALDDIRLYDQAVPAEQIRALAQKRRGPLIGAWNFDQTPDITFVPDWSGNGADLTAANVQLDDFVESATYSDQDRHALEFHTPYGTTLETDFAAAREVNTIATWVRSENPIVAAPVGIGDVLMEFNDTSGNGVATWLTIGPFFGTGINNETISLVQYLGGTNFRITAVTDAGELEVDEWAHVAFVWNETAGRYDAFINGQQAPVSTTGTGHVDRIESDHVGFGRRQLYGSPAYLNGALDDVRLYYAAVPAHEIEQMARDKRGTVIAAWGFDEGPGNAVAADSTKNGNDLLLTGVNPEDYVEPATATSGNEYALEFDVAPSKVVGTDLSEAAEINTISTWVRSDNPIVAAPVGIGDTLIEFADASGSGVATWLTMGPYVGTGITNETISLVQYTGTSFRITAVTDAGELDVDEWAHVAFVWNDSLGRYDAYINGALAAVSTTAYGHVDRIESDHVTLGRRTLYGSPTYLNGALDTVRLYSESITHDEILVLANRPHGNTNYSRITEPDGQSTLYEYGASGYDDARSRRRWTAVRTGHKLHL